MFPERLRQLGTTTVEYPAGAELPNGANGQSYVHLLVKGCVTAENSDGSAVAVFWPGDLIGMIGVVTRAASESFCVRLFEEELIGEMARSPEVAGWVWREQLKRLAELRRRVGLLNGASVEQRILQTVAELGECAKAATPDAVVPLAQKEVAELAGATRETTSTLLNRMRRLGLVSLRRRRIIVPAPQQLRDVEILAESQSRVEEVVGASA